MLLTLALLSCDQPEPEAPGLDASYSFVMSSLTFGRREGTETWGFDLDGDVSTQGDVDGCGHADMVSPEGEEGIDSAFSGLVPALEATEAAAAESLIQDTIRAGELLILVELDGIDDWENDDCVQTTIHRARGKPMLGTDGEILDGQSFAGAEEPAVVTCATLVDGALVAEGFDIALPVQVLDVAVQFNMQDAALRVDIPEPGAPAWGFMGGPVPLEDILRIVAEDDLADLREVITPLVTFAADMDADASGACQSLSIVLEFEGRDAFIVD